MGPRPLRDTCTDTGYFQADRGWNRSPTHPIVPPAFCKGSNQRRLHLWERFYVNSLFQSGTIIPGSAPSRPTCRNGGSSSYRAHGAGRPTETPCGRRCPRAHHALASHEGEEGLGRRCWCFALSVIKALGRGITYKVSVHLAGPVITKWTSEEGRQKAAENRAFPLLRVAFSPRWVALQGSDCPPRQCPSDSVRGPRLLLPNLRSFQCLSELPSFSVSGKLT